MKWSILQISTAFAIIAIMAVLEFQTGYRTMEPTTGQWTPVYSAYVTFFIIALVISCFYFLFLFEAKKEKSLFSRKMWGNMPKKVLIVGALSAVLFIALGATGMVFEWVEEWRFLLYIFLVYFLFLIYVFIFSFEHKMKKFAKPYEKTAFISYIWTLLLFFILFVFF
ncbi:hypothetical protein LGQ02_01395 [Bacillus shivajii]|uniref:hypothetical protein n=1 Tax=Bacillus shivajii TaxID=1983719 RepID=UPI001CFA1ED4|nr:hypothetical protein [Bacillus shivajii]UCZ53484.1 hypothetical protein LGQ02_01395 [Bacillus shivajii]